jgi:hypothetical protein
MGLKAIVDAKAGTPKLSDIGALVKDYAEAWWAEKDAGKRKDKVKARILALHKQNGVNVFDGDEGVISITQTKASEGVIVKMAMTHLTEEQIKACTGVTRKGSTKVEFKPAAKRPGE